MVNDSDIRVLHINAPEMALIRLMARAAMRGGKSYIRASSERRATLETDQLVGQLGTYAGHKFWFGHSYNYLVSRQQANLNPNTGDGGSDIVGANVDFKTSLIRSDRPLLDYRLVVRPIERKPAKVYVQLLADIQQNNANVYILGWADDAMYQNQNVKVCFKVRVYCKHGNYNRYRLCSGCGLKQRNTR